MLEYIRAQPRFPGRREVARAFGIAEADRASLDKMLGELKRGAREPAAPTDASPLLLTVAVTEIDVDDGTLWATAVERSAARAQPNRIRLLSSGPTPLGYAVGQRLIARVTKDETESWVGSVVRPLDPPAERIIGTIELTGRGGRIRPSDRRLKSEFEVASTHLGGARQGELVVAEALPSRHSAAARARVVERLGPIDGPQAISLIAILSHGIPHEFPPAAESEARALAPVSPAGRRDLRHLPLVTIDGADARDFDDAVYAEPDASPGNDGGFRLIVAIADVAAYVRTGSPLDAEARRRGNSVYFPDRVVPMLPERLSNDLCSLRPNEDRACLAVELRIDAEGRLIRHEFSRAIMRSAARLTYEQAQAAHDGQGDAVPEPLLDAAIRPLFQAYRALRRDRQRRGTIDLDLQERQVLFGADGSVAAIATRQRLDSHRLIEEFMIAANIAAAMSAQARRMPSLYRVHDSPELDRVDALRLTLAEFGYRLSKGMVLRPRHFAAILDWAAGQAHESLINNLVLRTQALAVYSPDNRGHFGLALRHYAHFTSPIRRYADLVVHRGLIRALDLGATGIEEIANGELGELGDHLSATERRAAAAERDTIDRFMASYLADRAGAEFGARISGVQRFGLFATLDELGADGLIPISSLADDFYLHDAESHRLVGRRSGRTYRLGDPVRVRLVEADGIGGRLSFELLEGGRQARPRIGAGSRPQHRRPRR